MTVMNAVSRVYLEEQQLVAECGPCAKTLHQSGYDRDVALGTFFLHHPNSVHAVHRPDLPAGWQMTGEPTP